MLRLFRRENPAKATVHRLYETLVERARAPVFYRAFRVADTIDGRFDLLTLHAFLVMEALRDKGQAGAALGEALATTIFTGFEEALRDLGVGDLGLSRRIKAMANAFYGRLEAYESAAVTQEALAAAILRNIYRGENLYAGEAAGLAKYMTDARARLATKEAKDSLLNGDLDYGPVPNP